MAAAILLLIWIYNEWSYDRFHDNEKQLYQAWSRIGHDGVTDCLDQTSILLGPTLKSDYPEIVEIKRVTEKSKKLFSEGYKRINILTCHVDPGFLAMFSFPLLLGDKESALKDTYSVILTEKAAKRFFGDEDPIGKVITLDMNYPMTVTGVMKDLPANTTFAVFFIIATFIIHRQIQYA